MSANPIRAYAAVTAAYWAFMLTDGALRMLVLLQFNGLGFSPVALAWLFLLYEVAGIATNLGAGWLAARFGLAATLYGGLGLQVAALVALTQLDPGWSIPASVAFVMAVQGVSGVAKDLAKMSSKSAVKLLAPSGEGGLFRWVAALTGSKNAVKGLGFFLGAALLALVGFKPAIWGMAGLLAAILIAVVAFLPKGLPGKMKSDEAWGGWRSQDPQVNRLSLARMFLFGARDVWFVVGLPVYFQAVLSDGTAEGRREAFFLTGGFMALWIIAYGAVQAFGGSIRKHSRAGLRQHGGRQRVALLRRLLSLSLRHPRHGQAAERVRHRVGHPELDLGEVDHGGQDRQLPRHRCRADLRPCPFARRLHPVKHVIADGAGVLWRDGGQQRIAPDGSDCRLHNAGRKPHNAAVRLRAVRFQMLFQIEPQGVPQGRLRGPAAFRPKAQKVDRVAIHRGRSEGFIAHLREALGQRIGSDFQGFLGRATRHQIGPTQPPPRPSFSSPPQSRAPPGRDTEDRRQGLPSGNRPACA
ncbi:MFS transporter permease [Rhodobacter capsulatus R121]|uniref:Nonfunctional major facilitator superfamily MFS_1 n=2 Tax=Rhodobacter capsulatus TaxID=1061 RepID=D5AV34_RHOCB|nr:cephamycin export protein [Rhodobacter capsulatus SB 1003]ADE85816.1 nonfunctional major facilitator superfamily MFS_1 [Rhodobacter capsulatus SB 1003]ETD01815.1 MFS transporter permease [Rhodobacter capsulatus DE442]ETD76883.1 MFS transporter permease [Rhodobacter capsulatus R121]ETE53720.1 MFS transporter permease [Rhodobacter capsulatus Y262]